MKDARARGQRKSLQGENGELDWGETQKIWENPRFSEKKTSIFQFKSET